jgi:hypothetical protein
MKMKGRLPEANYAQCANGYRIHYLDGCVSARFRTWRQWLQ